jgi:hypothetical protein
MKKKKKETLFHSDEKSELSGVWGKELFESDEKKKNDERSERAPLSRKARLEVPLGYFLTPIVLVLFLQKVRKKLYQKKKILKK